MIDKTVQLAEFLHKVLYFLLPAIAIFCIILPKAIFSFYKYFTTDNQSGVFELALPL